MNGSLPHQDAHGRPTMVDVSSKRTTRRRAVAEGTLRMSHATMAALREGRTPKGDPLIVARIAGIQAAKMTPNLIPLCHPLPLDGVHVDVDMDDTVPGVRATARVEVDGRTGVEMEALTAVAVSLLTVYDMLKGLERGMRIADIRLLEKSGGTGGDWQGGAEEVADPAKPTAESRAGESPAAADP